MRTSLALFVWLAAASPVLATDPFSTGKAADVRGDTSAALAAYEAGAAADDVRCQQNLAVLLLRQPARANEAVGWLRKAAAAGSPLAQATLGSILLHGNGVEKNALEASHWLEKAALAGIRPAQSMLGLLLLAGDEGIERNHERAAKWLQSAAQAGDARALNALGFLHESGQGAPREPAVAAALYRRAAELADAKGRANLGRLLATGHGVARDPVQAVAWLSLAERQGEPSVAPVLRELRPSLTEEERKKVGEWMAKLALPASAPAATPSL